MENLDFDRILLNNLPPHFLLEVVGRTIVMFIVIFITLRLSGKRGIKQLSVFEMVLIIGLGSAAGDPMFYEDVGILPAFTVFGVVIFMYMLVTKLTDKVRWAERLLEGQPTYLIRDGRLLFKEFEESNLSRDELFAELRLLNVEHLGQVRMAVLETSGEVSVLYFGDDQVKPGLPIFPGVAEVVNVASVENAVCDSCGHLHQNIDQEICPKCGRDVWCKSIADRRIA